jgi:energy-coupling factor transport system substrate-specific component
VTRRLLAVALYGLSLAVGVVALAYPFLRRVAGGSDLAGGQTVLLSVVLISLCLAVLLVEVQGQAAGAKTVAALGVLVAATSVLRFLEVGIPAPGGFSPVFAPIILGGYVFGPRFGFLLGAMTMLVSGIITAGVGPWLPYQMFTAGWVGLSAGWLPHLRRARAELALLVAFGVFWGFAFGAIMNLYTWPFLAGDPQLAWSPGAGAADALRRYAAFYMATSLLWDALAAAGNALLLLALGLPTLRALARFRDRLQFEVRPA